MNGLDFYRIHGHGPTLLDRLRAETDLGELGGLIAGRERLAVLLGDPAQRPTAEERAVYKERRLVLAKAAAARAAR